MQQLILPEFKIRCSAIGKIMTNPRGKSIKEKMHEIDAAIFEKANKLSDTKPTLKTYANLQDAIVKLKAQRAELEHRKDEPLLSETCISFLESWVNEQVYGRRVDFSSKQTAKGITVEDEAIIYASGFLNAGILSKNTIRFENEYMTGEPDVLPEDEVLEFKNSYSHETFPLYAQELPEKDYEWQGLGYMELTGKKKCRVVYCLMSMPDAMIEREARWKLGYDYSQTQYDEFAEQFRYDNLGPELRLKEYAIEYDLEKVTAIEKRVLDCRAYIQSVIIPELHKQKEKYHVQF